MPTRVIQAALCIGLLAIGAEAVEPSDLVRVKITVLDANGHSMNDLQQGDFVLSVDQGGVDIVRWKRAQDFFSHSTYTLAFRAARGIPPSRHSVEVWVKRQDAQLRYPSWLDY
jgi:hypothetical protein